MAHRNGLVRWLGGTSNRTFVLYPLLVAGLHAAIAGGWPPVRPWGAVLLGWGYLQYRLSGSYRIARGGGGPGMSVPPEHLVVTGPYRLMRHPMYLGHLVFLAGLAVTFRSWPAAVLLIAHVPWFHRRALDDEARLAVLFGPAYTRYCGEVRRWIPGVL